MKSASYISCVVFMSITVSHAMDVNPYLFAINRMIDTLIGIFVALFINGVHLPNHHHDTSLFVVSLEPVSYTHLADYLFKQTEYKTEYFPTDTVKGSQFLMPYFEVSGSCPGCGETPYYKLVSQLFGKDMLVANATGCSMIYCSSTPSTPFVNDANGEGVAWANSLFEDNAEFGYGMALSQNYKEARILKAMEAVSYTHLMLL